MPTARKAERPVAADRAVRRVVGANPTETNEANPLPWPLATPARSWCNWSVEDIMAHSFGQTGRRATGLLAHGAALVRCVGAGALATPGAVYQVAVNGADTNDGVAAPWKSFKGSGRPPAGDTLRVLPGEYRLGAAVIVKNKRAAAAAPITIEARGKVVLRDGATKVDSLAGGARRARFR